MHLVRLGSGLMLEIVWARVRVKIRVRARV